MDESSLVPFSAREYFSLLLQRAKRAEGEGNYAISAAVATRHRGVELLTLGANSVFAGQNPTGHAEVNAIMALRSVAVALQDELETELARGEREGSIIIRAAPCDRTESTLYTTLEPCPMCTVCIINAGIDRVVIAAEDPPSGSLAPERLAKLPPLWPELASNLEVAWTQSEQPDATDTFLPSDLLDELLQVFLRSRTRLDMHLGRHGTLDMSVLGDAVAATRGDSLSSATASPLSVSQGARS
jgi:tRNA(Arg) A34 adenosine deaminase TadA